MALSSLIDPTIPPVKKKKAFTPQKPIAKEDADALKRAGIENEVSGYTYGENTPEMDREVAKAVGGYWEDPHTGAIKNKADYPEDYKKYLMENSAMANMSLQKHFSDAPESLLKANGLYKDPKSGDVFPIPGWKRPKK
jgi:hypothetical protein